ncbi:MAG: kynureninase [Actinomycetia bacterium]|nr:kynureninase [Actinomycetes bacterium]MCP4086829.1 kynureninase [Actinomycetes bacterium]
MTSTRFTADANCAARLDADDPVAPFRDEFCFPAGPDGEPEIYLVGNSLGLATTRTRTYVDAELDAWATKGVRGHFQGDHPWTLYHELLTGPMAELVGGRPEEVVVMNSLTVNLHLLLVSFYRPSAHRHKILIEEHAFPSDHFVVESQLRHHGFDPADSMVVVGPRPGAELIEHDDLLAAIDEHGEELAVVLLPGVQYYTGQVFDMSDLVRATHACGARVGFDLAHAVGNIPLELHDWNVDFAAWCTYKYLNSGPGSTGAAFVHENHLGDRELPRFEGWWGTNKERRFEMATTFDPIPTVEAWQLSNAPILSMAPVRASLDLFRAAGGIGVLRNKSEAQLAWFDFLLDNRFAGRVESITPRAMHQRGCQFALRVTTPGIEGRDVFESLEAAGVACDWRYPDVIRVAPVPLYNSFTDIWRFTEILDELV